jgi:hypothetical protein
MELTVEDIEDKRIKYPKRGGNQTVKGKPLFFEFGEPLDDIESFIHSQFKNGSELHVWCTYRKLETDYYKVDAVATKRYAEDTETGNIGIEISPDWMRVYVKEGKIPASRVVDILETVDENQPITYKS